MIRRPWTDDDLAELEALWRAGKLSTPQIAQRIGRTRASIQSVIREDRARFPRRFVRHNSARLYVALERGLRQRVDNTARAHGMSRSLLLRTLIREARHLSSSNREIYLEAVCEARLPHHDALSLCLADPVNRKSNQRPLDAPSF